MTPGDALKALESYDALLLIAGLAIFCTAFAERVLSERPASLPLVLVLFGWLVFALPLGLQTPDPLAEGDVTERLTELGVIVALMGAGLKIDRPFAWRTWGSTWRLLGVTMPLTIAAGAFLGWAVAGLVPATAMLLGAVISPTDPVLASEVHVGAPQEAAEEEEIEEHDPTGPGEEDEVRFSLTSEAGLNDGLAFPYTNAAIAMAVAGANPGNWLAAWLLVDVGYKLGIAFLVGFGAGRILAALIMRIPADTDIARAMTGMSALAATLIVYALTELAGGYGFIATFVGAVTIRAYERDHAYQSSLHQFTEMSERLLTAGILLLLGGAVAGGILGPLNLRLVLVGGALLFIVRPLAGWLGLIGSHRVGPRERMAIGFFGIRGVGSLYYLSYALNQADFEGRDEVWALIAGIVVASVVVHGISAGPLMSSLDRGREKAASKHA